MAEPHIREFFAQPGPMSGLGEHGAAVEKLPSDVSELVQLVQGWLIYDVVAEEFYGEELSEERQSEIHIRGAKDRLDLLTADDKPALGVQRPPSDRLASRCNGYTVMLVALLRANEVPARARCGFAAYLNPGSYEDHWVCEYWNEDEDRWQLVDAQLDAVWRKQLSIDSSPLDVPRDQFLVAADAWHHCRESPDESEKFGISLAGLQGLWFVAGSLVRDLAALNKVEMLPWDVWGAQPEPEHQLSSEQLAFFDRLAKLTENPNKTFDEVRASYEDTEELRVPDSVFNALREKPEQV